MNSTGTFEPEAANRSWSSKPSRPLMCTSITRHAARSSSDDSRISSADENVATSNPLAAISRRSARSKDTSSSTTQTTGTGSLGAAPPETRSFSAGVIPCSRSGTRHSTAGPRQSAMRLWSNASSSEGLQGLGPWRLEPGLLRHSHQVRHRFGLHLLHDAAAVHLDRLLGCAELGGDLLVEHAGHQQHQHLALARGEDGQPLFDRRPLDVE